MAGGVNTKDTQGRETLVPLSKIKLGKRLRPLSQAHVEVTAVSMAERGQLQAIEIAPCNDSDGFDYVVTVGGHRWAAAGRLEWVEVRAIIADVTPAERALREIDENLIRHDLSALDRAVFLAERKRLYEEAHPETRHGGKREVAAEGGAMRFSADAAAKTNLSERAVQRACELAARLSPDVLDKLRETPLASNQSALERLAKEAPTRQTALVGLMTQADAPAKSIGDAVARLDGVTARPAEEAKGYAKFVDLWGRVGAAERRSILAFLVTADLPKGFMVKTSKAAVEAD